MSKKTVYLTAAAVLAASVVAELCGVHLHGAHWWPLPFGYNVFFGFVGAWLLIIVAKLVMAPLLQRDEDYYESRGEEDE